MPSANHTITVAFKISNPVHAAVYQWLYEQADSPSELMRAAVIAIYGYRAIEQSDALPDKKLMALLESNAELSKVAELNKAIASITPNSLPQLSPPAPLNMPHQPSGSVSPFSAMDSSIQRATSVTPPKAVEDDDNWDDEEVIVINRFSGEN
jgi:hypothetical protein